MIRHSLTLICLLLLIGFSFAQTPEIDKLRQSTDEELGSRCELCLAFAHHGMKDSALKCVSEIDTSLELTIESRINCFLTESYLAYYYNTINSTLGYYQKAFNWLESANAPFSVQQSVYMQALESCSYNVECKDGLMLSEQFVAICKEANEDSLLITALTYKAQFLECIDSSDTSMNKVLLDAEEIALKNPTLLGVYFYELGLIDYYFGRIPSAIESYLKAEHYFKEQETSNQQLYVLYLSLSDVYEELNDLNRSKEYLLIAQQLPDVPRVKDRGEFFNALGWSYYRLGNVDSALFYIEKSIRAYHRYAPGTQDIAYPFGNLGLILNQTGNLDSAAYYSKRAMTLFEETNYPTGVAESMNNLGSIQLKKGDNQAAIQWLQGALEIATDYADRYEEMNALGGLIEANRHSNPQVALTYYDSFIKLKLHFQGKEDALKAMQQEARYHESLNKDQIDRLKLESELKSLEIDRKNFRLIAISIGFILALVVAGIFYFYWFQHQKLAKHLQESNEINQRIISMISHDFRGPLNNIKLTLELLQAEDMDMNEFAVLAKDLYRQSCDVSLMFDSFLGWAISQKDGYYPHLESFRWHEVVKEVIDLTTPLANLKNVSISIHGESNIQIETDKMAVLLILRNLISNAIKYSHPNENIDVFFKREGEHVITQVKDYGIGMSEERLKRILTTGDGSILGTNREYGAGLGLRMVIKYVVRLGGSIDAQSEKEKGTTFTFSLPTKLG